MRYLIAFLMGVTLVACPSAADARHCHQFFVQKQVVAVPLYYATVSPGLVNEAIIQKAVDKAVGETILAIQSGQLQLNAPQTLPQTAPTSALQSCLRCHTGPQAKGGVDLSTGFADCATKLRWFEMAGLDKDVPAAMKPIIEQLRASNKIGDVTEAILKLETAAPAPPNGGLQ